MINQFFTILEWLKVEKVKKKFKTWKQKLKNCKFSKIIYLVFPDIQTRASKPEDRTYKIDGIKAIRLFDNQQPKVFVLGESVSEKISFLALKFNFFFQTIKIILIFSGLAWDYHRNTGCILGILHFNYYFCLQKTKPEGTGETGNAGKTTNPTSAIFTWRSSNVSKSRCKKISSFF